MGVIPAITEDSCSGPRFREIVAAGAELLARRASEIDARNVFPVPDGDTGTNLALTARAAVEAASQVGEDGVGAIAAALARGALLGARGNSGVIFSQFLAGFARGVAGRSDADALALAVALKEAATAARAAVDQPADGTILTVADDVARAADEAARAGCAFGEVLASAAREAGAAVERTRGALPVLREANVVDAGALGLATILEGMSLALRGEPLPCESRSAAPRPAALDVEPADYGFCTEFMIHGADLDQAAIREELKRLGDAAFAVGDSTTVRVHLHTFQPARALDFGASLGVIDQIKVDDMRDQNRRLRATECPEQWPDGCRLVVVVDGDGFAQLFRGLGATVVASGGSADQSLADRVLNAIRPARARQPVVVVGSDRALAGLRQVDASDGNAAFSPSLVAADPARAVAAALAFQAERSAPENARAMERALNGIRSAQITARGESLLGRLDDGSEVTDPDLGALVVATLERLGAARGEVITLYFGRMVSPSDAATVAGRVRRSFPKQDVELIPGGQPDQLFSLACE